MKKIVSFVLALVLLMSISVPSFAEQGNPEKKVKVIKEYIEIIDVDMLLERAKNNITDLKDSSKIEKMAAKAVLMNKDTKEEKDVEVFTTTQLLKTTEEDGVVKDYYGTTFIATVGYTRTDSDWDDSYSVMASSTIYWDEYQIGGTTVKEFNKVSGSWTISDSSVSLSRRSVTSRNNGTNGNTGFPLNQTDYKYPSSNSFSYSLPFTCLSPFSGVFGSETSVLLSRGTSSEWYLVFNNSLTF